MSRIGNNPVSFSEETTVSVADGIVTVKGKLGELSQKVDSSITISINENKVILTRDSEDKQVRSYHVEIILITLSHCGAWKVGNYSCQGSYPIEPICKER